MASDEYDIWQDEVRDKYRWFLDSCYDKQELILRIIELDPFGEKDVNFQDFRHDEG